MYVFRSQPVLSAHLLIFWKTTKITERNSKFAFSFIARVLFGYYFDLKTHTLTELIIY